MSQSLNESPAQRAVPMLHPLSEVQATAIGEGTRIWQYAVILPGARIGKYCNICAHTLIENDVIVGDAVTIKSGVYLWDGLRVADSVFIGPNVTFANDLFPRSKQHLKAYLQTHLLEGVSIGANATILPGVTLGEQCMIGAGAVVTKDIPARAVAFGNPAKVIRYL